ncbi:MAG: hypothetical protein ACKO96_31515, partial [Flammeovirgaceae bacterium]
MTDFNFLSVAPEAATSLRQAKSGTLSQKEFQPELFDFAGILGGFVNPTPEVSLVIPESTVEHDSTEVMAAHSLVSNREDKAELVKFSDIDPIRLPSTVGSDFNAVDPLQLPSTVGSDFNTLDPLRLPSTAGSDFNALEHRRLSVQRFPAISSAPFDVDVSAAAVCDQPAATDQSGSASGLNLSNSANRISGSAEVVTGGLANSTQRLNHDARKKIDGDTLLRRIDVNTGFAIQAETTLDSARAPAAISLATPMLPFPKSTQNKPISLTDFRSTVKADTGAPIVPNDPAVILGVGELLGVAGKLQFTKESPSTSLIH